MLVLIVFCVISETFAPWGFKPTIAGFFLPVRKSQHQTLDAGNKRNMKVVYSLRQILE